MNILTGLAAVKAIVKDSIYAENVTDGILEDVESIITVANNEEGIDEPAIWIVQHPTVPAEDKTKLSREMKLSTTFEFVCIEYDEDPEKAELKSQDLAARTVLALNRNFQQVQAKYNQRVIKNIKFNRFYPVGEISVQGKREKVPVTAVAVDIIHYIDWLNCCKKPITKEEDNTEENNNDNNNEGE